MIICNLCQGECKSLMNLSRHLSNKHKVSPREYYDLHLKKENEDICVVCGENTLFRYFTNGYNNTCSRKCAAILFRKELKNDEKRFVSFQNTVSINQEKIWKNRKEITTEDGKTLQEVISKKVGLTAKKNNALLTTKQKKEKFGWINKLSDKEKEIWKKEIMFKTGCHLFWNTASEEKKKSVQLKRNASKLGVSEEIIKNLEKNLEDKQLYRESVEYLTSITYNRYKNTIDPNNLSGKGYHLDHRYSVIFGFINKIPPEIISSLYNLEIITENENLKKSSNVVYQLTNY